MQVHLCAHSPCHDPGAADVHMACSASVGRATEYDLQEMDGRARPMVPGLAGGRLGKFLPGHSRFAPLPAPSKGSALTSFRR